MLMTKGSTAIIVVLCQGSSDRGTSRKGIGGQILGLVENNLLMLCPGLFLTTFPDGRFAPCWSWPTGFALLLVAISFELPSP